MHFNFLDTSLEWYQYSYLTFGWTVRCETVGMFPISCLCWFWHLKQQQIGSWFNPLQQDSILCDKLVHIMLHDVSHEIEKFGSFWILNLNLKSSENIGCRFKIHWIIWILDPQILESLSIEWLYV